MRAELGDTVKVQVRQEVPWTAVVVHHHRNGKLYVSNAHCGYTVDHSDIKEVVEFAPRRDTLNDRVDRAANIQT